MDDQKKDTGIGKIILIVLAVVVALGLLIYFIARMSGKNNGTTTTTAITTTATTTNASTTNNTGTTANTTENTTQNTATGELGSQTVTIKEHRLVKEENGKDAIVITYTVKNNGNAAMNFLTMLSDKAYQGDEKLNDAVLKDIEDFNANSINFNIEKGASYDVQKAFILKDTTTPVRIDVHLLTDLNGEAVTKTFEIK